TPKFDVATIKSNRTGSGSSNLPVLRHGRMTANNVSLLDLLDAAYGFTSLTTRGPDWLNTERFDITAKAPEGVPDTELMPMLQALLGERFKVQVHHERKRMPVYDMTVVNAGVKMSPFDGSHFPAVPPNRGGSMIIGVLTMEDLARKITFSAGRPVIDKTNLPGRYALTLMF